jgi:hypothetical protein
MDAFIDHILDDYKSGTIIKSQAAGSLNHVMTALAEGNHGEAVNWFEQGRKLVGDSAA